MALPGTVSRAPRDVFFTSDGLRLHALDWGVQDGRGAVFLHGAGLSAHTWDRVCGLLSAELRCVALDLRGHGESDWATGGAYALEDFCRDVDALLATMGIKRPLLVGNSLGGRVTLAYARRRAYHVSAIALVDSGAPSPRPGNARVRDFMLGLTEAASFEDFFAHAMRFDPTRDPDRLRRSLQHNLREGPDGKWRWKYDTSRLPRVRTPEELAERERELWDDVSGVKCPALVVRGGDSDVLLDEDAARLTTALARATLVRVEGAGHTVQRDRPDELATAIRDFLRLEISTEGRAR